MAHGRMDLSVKQQLRSYTDFVQKDIYERMLSMCSCIQQASHIHKLFTCICHETLRERYIIYGRVPYTLHEMFTKRLMFNLLLLFNRNLKIIDSGRDPLYFLVFPVDFLFMHGH